MTQQFILKAVKFIIFWLVFALLFYLVARNIKLFIPIIGGLILFGVMNPMVKILERRTFLGHKWSVASALIIIILGLGGVVAWLTLLTVRQIQELILKGPTYVESLRVSIDRVWPKLQTLYLGLDPKFGDAIKQSIDHVVSNAYDMVSHALYGLSSLALTLPELAIMLVITFVAAFFITKNWIVYKSYLVNIFPTEWRDGLRAIGNDFSLALVGFLRAQVILVLGTIVVTIAGLSIIHVPYYLLIGLVAGLFAILPVLGAGLLLVPWAIIEIILGNMSLGLELLALVAVLSVLRHIFEPQILGDNVGLDPLFVLLGMYIGLELIGPTGLIIGPFVIIFYKSLQSAGVFKNL
ncbi:MAG: sporulation integral membrane protein YtvI [Peptococcaceae bacterium]|nr:sporulation integral membrane protein YtvI [Peptococcaceae bacterium]